MTIIDWLLLAAATLFGAAALLAWKWENDNPQTCPICGETHPQPKKGVPSTPGNAESATQTKQLREKEWQGGHATEHLTAAQEHQIVQTWCNVCKKKTKRIAYRVSVDSRAMKPGPCLEHGPKVNDRGESAKQEKARIKREHDKQNPSLF